MEVYTVLNIFRANEHPLSFVICVLGNCKEYYRIDRSLSDRVSKGMVFIGDRIIIKETTSDGIVFEVVDGDSGELCESESDIEFLYSEPRKTIKPLANPKSGYLPYLCDILPYSNVDVSEVKASPIYKNGAFIGRYQIEGQEVSNIRLPLPSTFVAKILQKTRINVYPTSFNPFFFIIVSSNNILLKVVFWSESLKQFSNLHVGDVIMIKDYKAKKKWTMVDKVEPNTFTESAYFDVEEITAKDLVRIACEKKAPLKHIFECIEGEVEYISVLMRHNCNGSLLEYVLMRVDGKMVVLFYNSDPNFYKIQCNTKINIVELRKIDRAGVEMYVSTIYTQFEIDIHENFDEQQNPKQINLDEQQNFNQINLDEQQNPKKMKISKAPSVFGAIGFIPDNFAKVSDILEYNCKENVLEREISVSLFMRPTPIALEDLQKQNLVLNESKKFLINCSITKTSDVECIIDYFENGENKKQSSFAVILDNLIDVFIYDNFFTNRFCELLISKASEPSLIGKPCNFVIEAFRVDETRVLYYLTGIIMEN